MSIKKNSFSKLNELMHVAVEDSKFVFNFSFVVHHFCSNLNKLEGVAANRFLSSGDHAASVTPPPALYKGVAVSKATSHTFNIYTDEITAYQL